VGRVDRGAAKGRRPLGRLIGKLDWYTGVWIVGDNVSGRLMVGILKIMYRLGYSNVFSVER
jgi:hypothetical protein